MLHRSTVRPSNYEKVGGWIPSIDSSHDPHTPQQDQQLSKSETFSKDTVLFDYFTCLANKYFFFTRLYRF